MTDQKGVTGEELGLIYSSITLQALKKDVKETNNTLDNAGKAQEDAVAAIDEQEVTTS